MYDLINSVLDTDKEPRSGNINFLFHDLFFIEPVGVTVLSNITNLLANKNVRVTYTYPPIDIFSKKQALCFLDDSQYFKQYTGVAVRPYASIRGTTIPLELVSIRASYQWFDKVMYWLAGRISVTVESLANIKMCLQEVFNNINDHSTQSIGSAFIQHYPNKNRVSIAISDFGVGIPFNIQGVYPFLNDALALEKSIEQGFSTKSSPRNRGAGLDTLIYNVVKNNQGYVYIHSNYGILKCKPTENNSITLESELTPVFYPGTLIEVILRTDTIENIEINEEEFEW
nr:ATP-binding protein [Paenibacillus brevis]